MDYDDNAYAYMSSFVDDLSGKSHDPTLVKEAREKEMMVFEQHNVFTFVPVSDCYTITGNPQSAHDGSMCTKDATKNLNTGHDALHKKPINWHKSMKFLQLLGRKMVYTL